MNPGQLPLTHGALFAGVLGFGLAAQWAGIETVWYSEVSSFCNEHNAINFPAATAYGDIRGLSGLPWCNIISGGFPCQDISGAGKGAGIAGARSGLWSEYCRILGEVRPDYAIIENSPLLTVRGLDIVLSGLAKIGYDAVWDCVRASAYGAPHARERLYLIAYPNSFGRSQIPHWPCSDSSEVFKCQENWCTSRWDTATASGYGAWRIPLAHFRGLDDGISPELVAEEFTAFGNAVVPQIPHEIFEAIKRCYE